jgi:hypothetical protein
MSPQARIGLIAVGIVGSLFFSGSCLFGLLVWKTRSDDQRPNVVSPKSATTEKSAKVRAPSGGTPVGPEISITGTLDTIFPQCDEAWQNMLPGRDPVQLPRTFPLALVVKTRKGEYTCLIPKCTPAELDRKYRPLEGRTVVVRGTLITSIGLCQEMFNCHLVQ